MVRVPPRGGRRGVSARLHRLLRWVGAVSGATAPTPINGPLPPGVLLLQLDGLSRPELEASLAAGRMPFLASLLREQGYRCHSVFSGLPATTPSFQGEFFYGVRQSVPAWAFLERETGEIAQFLDSKMVARREEHLKSLGSGLLTGGSAYACLLGGGAAEVHFCTGKERWLNFHTQLPPLTRAALSARYLARAPRVTLLMVLEALRALWQMVGSAPPARDQLSFLFKRVALDVAVRRYMRAGIGGDLVRGVPIIFGNFLDYDCHAHMGGPHSDFARQVLPGLDLTLRHLWTHARRSGRRRYQVWIFSDHGQQSAVPFSADDEGLLARLLQPYLSAEEKLVIADNGPLGHIYLEPRPTDERLEQLASVLVKDLGVPQVAWLRGAGGAGSEAFVLNSKGRFSLNGVPVAVVGQHRFSADSAEDLSRLTRHPEAGDLIALGWSPERCVSYARELGCHGGPGPEETHAFALLPEDAPVDPSAKTLRALDLREAALRHLQSPPM